MTYQHDVVTFFTSTLDDRGLTLHKLLKTQKLVKYL